MNEIIENFLATVDNLSKLEPKNLPLDVLFAMSELSELELFKICTYLFVLRNNIPSKNNIINLSDDEIKQGAQQYAKEILARLKESS